MSVSAPRAAGLAPIGSARLAAEIVIAAVLFALFARTFVAQAFLIPSASMEPTLRVGDHVLVNKLIFGSGALPFLPQRAVERGDIVVFRSPEDPARDFVKRCVGLPGDRIEIRDKALLINGVGVDESAYVAHRDSKTYPRSPFLSEPFAGRDNLGPLVVPPNSFFFLGDNRDNSSDSRFWGTVPATSIRGRAVAVYWSIAPAEHPVGSWSERLRQRLGAVRWRDCLRIVR